MSDLIPSEGTCPKCRAEGEMSEYTKANRLCEHGSLKRKCNICDLKAERATKGLSESYGENERLKALLAEYDKYRGKILEKDALCETLESREAEVEALREALRKLVGASNDLLHGSVESAPLWAALGIAMREAAALLEPEEGK